MKNKDFETEKTEPQSYEDLNHNLDHDMIQFDRYWREVKHSRESHLHWE